MITEALKGTIHGNHIELEQVPSVPDGSLVLVSIAPFSVADDEGRRRILDLCGTWKNDPSIPVIFNEIAQERHAHCERELLLP